MTGENGQFMEFFILMTSGQNLNAGKNKGNAGLTPHKASAVNEPHPGQFANKILHMSNPQQLVQKLWNYCSILRDDGLSYGDLAHRASTI
jgi:hypothetical protein